MKLFIAPTRFVLLAAGSALAAPIDFESPLYTPGNLSSVTAGTIDKAFTGQEGWSQSTSNSPGFIAATATAGLYAGGQAVRATNGQTYIGAKKGYTLIDPGTQSFTFDLRYGSGQEAGIGLWKDEDGDGAFDQSEAQVHFGVVGGSTPFRFGYRSKGFGARFESPLGGINGNWYRFVVSLGQTQESGAREVTVRIVNLTTEDELDFDPNQEGLQPWVTTITAANFGAAPQDSHGMMMRVTNDNAHIDNINGPPPPAPPLYFPWSGSASPNKKWSTAANWKSNATPPPDSLLLFTGNEGLDSENDLAPDTPFNGLEFDGSAADFIITGNSITLNGRVINRSISAQTLELGLKLPSHIPFVSNAGKLVIDGPVSGNGGIIKSGSGTLEIAGLNSYLGGITASAGRVILFDDQKSATGSMIVGPDSSVTTQLEIAPEAQALVSSSNRIRIGNEVAAGTAEQTLSNFGTTTNHGTLFAGRQARLIINDGATWNQHGAATIEGLGGYNAILIVASGGAFHYHSESPITLRSGTNDAGRSLIRISGGTLATASAFLYDSQGSFKSRIILSEEGTLRLMSSMPDLDGGAEIQIAAEGGTIDTGSHAATIRAPLTGTGTLTKSGSGTLTLAASTGHSGPTTVSAGTLELLEASLDDNAAVSVATGASLKLSHNGSDTVTSLTLGNQTLPPGSYSSATHPAFITGTGAIIIPSPITVLYAEYRLGEASTLGPAKRPLDSSGNFRNFTSEIGGDAALIGNTGSIAPGSTAYLDTSPPSNNGWYSTNLFTDLPADNFAFGVFARAASTNETLGDVFTVGGATGSLKLSLASNGWAASAHNSAWIAEANGVSGSFTPETWVHLALIRSRGITTFYIDGIPQAGTYSGTPINDTAHLSVSPGGNSYFNGQIDEARVVTFSASQSTENILGILRNGISAPPALGFAQWANTLGLSGGPSADFDGDGIPDAVEYVVGTDPKLATPSPLTSSTQNGNITFTFKRHDEAETQDMTVEVEFGTDLKSWPQTYVVGSTTALSSPGIVVTENASEPDTITLSLPVTTAARQFARLKVGVKNN
jgi:autotransporter-associated beta strand protein